MFKNDRYDLTVGYENNRLYWTKELKYDVYYLSSYSSQFPPTTSYTSAPSKKVVSDKSYIPRTRECDVYDLVMAMKLYEAHSSEFSSAAGSNYASTAVYAYTFSNKALENNFENYLKTIRWDGEKRKWMYSKQDGTSAPADTSKLVIFYSSPAYLTIVNNNASGLELDISDINVLGKDAADGVYGYVTAKNGATIQTLRPLKAEDLTLAAGESIKLMFPGAQNQSFSLSGSFTGEGAGDDTSVTYTFNGGSEQTIVGTQVNLSGDTFKFYNNDTAAELIFGTPMPICKIGDVPFTTLKGAMKYAVDNKMTTCWIEMLVDYLVPKDDVLEIPAGYDITFTTASRDAATLPYTGNGTKATLSRDTGNEGASVKAKNSVLTVKNLAFDGRSLTAKGAGGAINTENCATVLIDSCDFTGYRAEKGGAVYSDNKNPGSILTVANCTFSNCQTNFNGDKFGGGGVWTTARALYVRNCSFDGCACTDKSSNAQAGSVFHNIQQNWSKDSITEISDCTFSNSYSAGGSGGAVESDALDVTIQRCSFIGSYTNKSGGSGGAINTYANNAASTGTYCKMSIIDCYFENCSAKNGSAMGGAVRCSTHDLTLRGCFFRNTQGVTGGAVAMTNSNAKKVEIYGCTFENCIATGNGGAVSAPVGTLIVGMEDSSAVDYVATYQDPERTRKDGDNHFTGCTANLGGGIYNAKTNATVSLKNVSFTRCEAKTGSGGALYTQAKTLSVTGSSNIFTNCTAQDSGGAVFQNINNATGSSVTLQNFVFTDCESKGGSGNGGGMYTNAKTLSISGDSNSFINCSANNSGGGLYHTFSLNGDTVNIANCCFDSCTAKADTGGGMYTNTHSLTITGINSKFRDCTAQTNGGGLYHNQSAAGSEFSFSDGSFDSCTAIGSNGGAIYTGAKTVTLKDGTVSDSTSKAAGGGIWTNPATASFEGCTITGNSVTNSDSKGGGVYIAGGTATYNSGTVSGCSAANGGGWYQTDGTLNILGGSISGNATNGGGIYQAKGTINHYSGTVAGTATANGGGVYKNGTYTIGDATYGGTAYSGASIGAVTVDEGGSSVYTATAANGGGIYQNDGTLTLNAGAGIAGQAAANGGGIWNKTTVTHNGGDVTGSAVDGGGVWQTDTANGKYTFNGGTITGTATENGGAFYQGGNSFTINDGTIGERTFAAASGNEGSENAGEGSSETNTSSVASSAKNGGGLYVAAGKAEMGGSSNITGANAAANGGGVYVAGGTFSLSGGDIKKNKAAESGGGIYHAGGTLTVSGGTIGGSAGDANTASKGAGIFVAEGQSAAVSGGTITLNKAAESGGGIAVGGRNAKLNFQGSPVVRYNTMGANDTPCNVYLNYDSNAIIQTTSTGLSAGAFIGVYASVDQYETHGQSGMHFGTRGSENNLDCFRNDRLPYLYGVKGSGSLIDWANFVCKITDGDGNLLYKDTEGTPAVYGKLENNGGSGNDNAFGVLSQASPSLYQLGSNEKYSGPYQIQMLVPDYVVKEQMSLNISGTITLTTASVEEDECGFHFTGDPRFPQSAITRQGNYGSMIYLKNTGLEFSISNLILDGGSGSGYTANTNGGILLSDGAKSVTITDAVLRNSKTGLYGGGIHAQTNTNTIITLNNTTITNCVGGDYGGGISVEAGTLVMNGGSITNCSAKNGGGVRVDTTMEMNGGTITGNNATVDGGGISAGTESARLYFSGLCDVTGNTLNSSTRCNVQLGYDRNAIINANGLDARSEIGVYTTGDIYSKHGVENMPFGTRKLEDDNFYCFINDRHTYLRGYRGANNDLIYWEYHPLLMVTKDVVSDWPEDQTREFTFTVQLADVLFTSAHNVCGDMDFNRTGMARVTVKAGESKTAVLPATLHLHAYTVTENLGTDQQEDYTTAAEKDGKSYVFADPMTVTGQLGENVGRENPSDESQGGENSSSLSDLVFINTRMTGDLTVSKTVNSSVEEDKGESFSFKLTLDPNKTNAKDKINKTCSVVRKDSEGVETEGTLSFTQGVAEFTLKDGQSITFLGLPTDLPYKVEEILTDRQTMHVRTFVRKDEGADSYSTSQTGRIGDYKKTVTEEGVKKTIYASDIYFTNSFLEIVCKITNRSRAILYYKDASGTLQPAVFSHLEEAFDLINSGGVRTSTGGTASGNMRIEMVVPAYTMERTATLNSQKTVILSTALPTDSDFPYNNGVDDGVGISMVSRGFTKGSMIVDRGSLTLDKITLDGSAAADEPVTGSADGGIVQVADAVRLTVNSAATLQNSAVTGSEESGGAVGNGGAVYLSAGAFLTMNGTIQNCSAANGGGIYAADGFITITLTGHIANCEAAGDGGAICAEAGTSVNLNAGTLLTGNKAAKDGGAVRTGTNLVLRGTVGGTEVKQGNTAGNEGGGIYMGSNAMLTMYTGSEITGNSAKNGGGLFARYTTRIAGGSIAGNEAKAVNGEGGLGGALYVTEDGVVTVSGLASLADNRAVRGGAVYDRGSVTMNGGSMTGNVATEKGGAAYVADTTAEDGSVSGHSFSMNGGSIKAGNKSPEGAISTEAHAVLNFSGNCDVSGNTSSDGETVMNVYLGYDSNGIIRTTGLGASANVGIYVADGEPETDNPDDPAYREDHSDHPIYADHGVAGRNFGTYTGSNLSGAKLNKFVNDRETGLTGMNGEQINAGDYYVAWQGLGLKLKVTQYLPKLDESGEVELDEEGNPVLSGTVVPVQNASFTFTNITNATEENPGVLVWSGKSDAAGLVSIPWGGEEKEGGTVASFKPNTTYRLDQTTADTRTVLPAGHWTVTISRDNSVTWSVTESGEANVDRIFNIYNISSTETPKLGETFGLNNDVKPTMTFNATGGVLRDRKAERTDTVNFTTTEVKHRYTITEPDPNWDSHVFKQWATMPNKPDVEVDTAGKTEEEIIAAREEKLKELGYYEYTRGNTVTFFRGTDTDLPAVKYTGTESRGNMTLYAQWDPVVCKITASDGNVLYESESGYPAAYGTLEEGFNALNSISFVTKDGASVRSRATLYLKLLVPEYTMTESVELTKLGSTVLTTAKTTDTDGYPYSGTAGTVCTIYCGDCSSSMIENTRNLTLRDITLDGRRPQKDMYGNVTGYETVTRICDGGFIDNRPSSILTVASNATLQNASVEGNGGAINLTGNASLTMSGGAITGCSATGSGGAVYAAPNAAATISGGTINGNTAEYGAGVCLSENSTLNLSGNPDFGGAGVVNDVLVTEYQSGEAAGNFATWSYTAEANEKNGGKNYTRIRQDIFIAGYADTDPAASLNVTGNLTSGDGTIWVWAENVSHYEMLKQFAVFSGNGTGLSNAAKENSVRAFRDAQPDSLTNCGGDYLTGQRGEAINGWECIYWTGGFNVVLRKIDSFGKDMNGATFTLYKSSDTGLPTTEEVQRNINGTMQAVTATSRNYTEGESLEIRVRIDADNAESRTVYGNSLVLFEKIPVGTYYIKETGIRINGVDRTADYHTAEEQYKLVIDKNGWYTLYAPIHNADGTLSWLPAANLSTAPTTLFVGDANGRYTNEIGTGANTLAVYTLLNVPKTQRKVILRKVSDKYEALQGAQFQIFRCDGTPVTSTDINGTTTTTFTSGASGVYFIDKLPYGTYYLYEKTAPSGYTPGKWFTLTVSDDNKSGVSVAEIVDNNTITRLTANFIKP